MRPSFGDGFCEQQIHSDRRHSRNPSAGTSFHAACFLAVVTAKIENRRPRVGCTLSSADRADFARQLVQLCNGRIIPYLLRARVDQENRIVREAACKTFI